jgi:hypothetical protein
MALRTAIELGADGGRTVYHERTAPPDKRLPNGGGSVTHAWTHEDTPEAKAACPGCTSGTVPKEAF